MRRIYCLTLATLLVGPGLAQSDRNQVLKVFAARFPGLRIDHLSNTPVPDIYQLGVEGQVFYLSSDGRYLFSGKLIDLDTRENLTETYLSQVRLQTLENVPDDSMIIYETQRPDAFTITTFTDIDCPFCRKMHEEIDELTASGIRVRYLLYPRAGVDSQSYEKAVSVWCAPDRQKALTEAKKGVIPSLRDCANPVQDHMALGRQLGLTGTPMTITETGERIVGYVPAAQLLQQLRESRLSMSEQTD